MSRVAVIQSNYIPWIGYFEIISSVSDFVFLDNVQYTTRDWRNRNQIKTPQGKLWLSLEVEIPKKEALIQEVTLAKKDEKIKHLDAIRRNYRRSSFFDKAFEEIKEIYESYEGNSLSMFNHHMIESLSRKLGIETSFHNAQDFVSESDPSRRILQICKSLNATMYVSGPSARDYLDLELFKSHGIEVEWFEYSAKPFRQLWGDFDQNVTVLDPILNNGWNILFDRGSKS